MYSCKYTNKYIHTNRQKVAGNMYSCKYNGVVRAPVFYVVKTWVTTVEHTLIAWNHETLCMDIYPACMRKVGVKQSVPSVCLSVSPFTQNPR